MDKDTLKAQLEKRKNLPYEEQYDDASSWRSGMSMSKGGPQHNRSIHETE